MNTLSFAPLPWLLTSWHEEEVDVFLLVCWQVWYNNRLRAIDSIKSCTWLNATPPSSPSMTTLYILPIKENFLKYTTKILFYKFKLTYIIANVDTYMLSLLPPYNIQKEKFVFLDNFFLKPLFQCNFCLTCLLSKTQKRQKLSCSKTRI